MTQSVDASELSAMTATQQDLYWMQRAIALSTQALYCTKPNPNVGCVIVKNAQCIGEGFHPRAGQPHAEVFALRQAGAQAQGATAYVTLEPCAHFGRTPPCAEALVKAQVARVVIACNDPNPLVAGKGVAILQAAGITVTQNVATAQAQQYNRGFLKAMSTGMPYVRAKIASSLDGRTAMASGESKWITGAAARLDVQHWRALSGAVITGIQTVLADDCSLNVRELAADRIRQHLAQQNASLAEQQAQQQTQQQAQQQPNEQLPPDSILNVVQPKRIILDRQGQLPLHAKILAQPEQVMVMGPYRAELAALGVVQLPIQNLNQLLRGLCQQHQIYDVLIEAGSTLSSAFIQQGLVDELICYVAPSFLGHHARPMLQYDIQQLSEQMRWQIVDHALVGQDLRLILQPDLSAQGNRTT